MSASTCFTCENTRISSPVRIAELSSTLSSLELIYDYLDLMVVAVEASKLCGAIANTNPMHAHAQHIADDAEMHLFALARQTNGGDFESAYAQSVAFNEAKDRAVEVGRLRALLAV